MTQLSPEPAPAQTMPSGLILEGRWILGARLGSGGFATVYHGKHLKLGREVAIKILEVMASPQEMAIIEERFLREAKLSAQLEHPNIVQILDYGILEHEGHKKPFIVMELLRGHELEDELLKLGPMAPARAKTLFMGALDALGASHAQGIVHRDLKPSNLFICNPGSAQERMVVLDFGIARVFDDPNSKLTATQSVTGTPAYLAPEYIESHQSTPAVDVYQMALIIGETLTGTPVVQASAPLGYLMAHVNGQQRLDERIARTALGVQLKRAMSVDPTARPQDANQLKQVLEPLDWEDARTIASPADAMTLPELPVPTVKAAQPSAPIETPKLQPPRQPQGGAKTGLIVGAIAVTTLVFAGIGVAGFLLYKQAPAAPAAPAPTFAEAHTAHAEPATPETTIQHNTDATAPAPTKAKASPKTEAPTQEEEDAKPPALKADAKVEVSADAKADAKEAKAQGKATTTPSSKPKSNAPKADPLTLYRPSPEDKKLIWINDALQTALGEAELNYRAYKASQEKHGEDQARQTALSFSDVARSYKRAAAALRRAASMGPAASDLDKNANEMATALDDLAEISGQGYKFRMSNSDDAAALKAIETRYDRAYKAYAAARSGFARATFDYQVEVFSQRMQQASAGQSPAMTYYYGALLELTRALRAAEGDPLALKAKPFVEKVKKNVSNYEKLDLRKLYPDLDPQIINTMNAVMRSAKVAMSKFDAQRSAVKKGQAQQGARGEQTIASALNYTYMAMKITFKRHAERDI